ncbi:MAG: NAD-dependent epimerase/dehydratase family protein [Phycisphaerales bacterium]
MKRADEPRRILVTGGAGFIGSHLVERLLAQGALVTVVDDFSTGRRQNLAAVHDADRLTIIDSTVSAAIDGGSLPAFTEIYHLAAAVGVRLILERPIQTIETNILETASVLRFAAKDDTPILIASSSEVYGKSTATPFAEEDDVVYGPTSKTRWSYACTKAIDEYLALAHSREETLPAVIVRFFNTVGPRQVGDYGMVLPLFVRAALEHEPLRVFGDGSQVRCFCDVREVVEVLPKLLRTPGAYGRVFNLGRDEPISIHDLARRVIETLDSRSSIEFVPYENAYQPGFEDLMARVPDIGRIRETVGFEPKMSLEQTILDIAESLGRITAVETECGDGRSC